MGGLVIDYELCYIACLDLMIATYRTTYKQDSVMPLMDGREYSSVCVCVEQTVEIRQKRKNETEKGNSILFFSFLPFEDEGENN